MEPNILFIVIHFSINSTLLAIIWIFLLIQSIKSDKKSRPFMTSVTIYFLCLFIGIVIQVVLYILDIYPKEEVNLNIYHAFAGYVFTLAAPIYLLYQLENLFFKNTNFLSKYHVYSLSTLLFYIIFILMSIIATINDPLFLYTFYFSKLGIFLTILYNFASWVVAIIFLYIAIKSSEKHRLYAFLTSLGWAINQISNTFIAFPKINSPNFNDMMLFVTIIMVLKDIGMILTGYSLYKLYSLKSH